MFFDRPNETLSRPELEALQLKRLKSLVTLAYDKIPFYSKKLRDCRFKPDDFKDLSDLSLLPFTDKDDLRNNYPDGLSAVAKDQIVRYHASSGTTGKITVVGYTAKDIETWSALMARCLMATGVDKSDVVDVAYGYGLFTGGLGAHYGAELLGAAVLPCSSGGSHRQIRLMRDLKVTALCCTPTYALYLGELANEMGLDFRDKAQLPLKTGVFGAEPWSEEMRLNIEAKLGINAMNIYGLSEVMGPGISIECLESKVGLHIFEDHFLPEIIDPQSGQVLGPGREGELVLTTLTKQGTPLIRYRTKDITSFIEAPCPCGRTHRRMTRVMGRSDDMVIIRGINVYPSQIESLILEIPALSPNYKILLDRKDNLDTLEIQIEPEASASPGLNEKAIMTKLSRSIKDYLGVGAQVTLLAPKTLTRGQGKTQRVFDLRQGKL
ncbi:MAG: phenylacetate--CoA ligase [Deltaproteobacteria bacterium]|jgi:phenylacetate-CoA ligase|nr:phenylacetate--CoA ligase [Deltaproteobacteria bacterium]